MSNSEEKLNPDQAGEPVTIDHESAVEDEQGVEVEQQASESAASTEDDPVVLLAAAQEEIVKFRDVALRAEAEMANVRRRAERDVENAHKFGVERFVQNMLPVIDGLEKAIELDEQAGTRADDPVLEGVRLCHKLLQDVLTRENVEVVNPEGEPFNPNEHEAMSMVENPDMEPNSVFTVIQKGYKLNDRLVRPAMVMVTKEPAS